MNSKINPWAWIPTLYFAQGIPYFIVNTVVGTINDATATTISLFGQDLTSIDIDIEKLSTTDFMGIGFYLNIILSSALIIAPIVIVKKNK